MAVKSEKKTETTKPSGLVKIKLFKDNYKYKDDVLIGVNGKFWQIKRGVEVEVPDYVAEVIMSSIRQDEATASLIERESSAAKNAEALL